MAKVPNANTKAPKAAVKGTSNAAAMMICKVAIAYSNMAEYENRWNPFSASAAVVGIR